MKAHKSNPRRITLAAAFMAAWLILSAPAQAAVVHSFNMGTGTVSGDVTAAFNTDGLLLTGETGNWANIWTSGNPSATDDGVTLTFNGDVQPIWGGTVGDSGGNGVGTQALRMGSFLGGATDIPWTLTGLTANGFYDMVWWNKRDGTGDNRAPNTGVTGFDAGNGVGVSAPHDNGRDQNFVGVQADGTGTISGTWFLAGGLEDITAVAGVQVIEAGNTAFTSIPEPSTMVMFVLGGVYLGFRRKKMFA